MLLSRFPPFRFARARRQALDPNESGRIATAECVDTRPGPSGSSAAPSGPAFMALARSGPRDAARLLLREIVGDAGDGAGAVLRVAAALGALRTRSLGSLYIERLLRAFVSEVSSWARDTGQVEMLSTALSLFGRVDVYERTHGPLAAAVPPDPDLSIAWEGVERLRSEAWRIVLGRCGRLVDVSAANFDEQAYLDSNPDVRDAVANGSMTSGHQHFLEFGVPERRQILDFTDA